MSDLRIYKFGEITQGNASMKDVLGGKGANLAEMASLGMPVPSGFTIPCQLSVDYADGCDWVGAKVDELIDEGRAYLTPKKGLMPLLSVRSGARVSMPGMMDTILNVGITSETLPKWKKKLGDVAALDSYRRLIQMYASVAMGVKMELFEDALAAMKQDAGVKLDNELNADQLQRLVKRYLTIVLSDSGLPFPDTLTEQLRGSVVSVFRSWNNPRAKEYRKINSIPESWGTAVNVQTMVFGNLNDKSATGVLFSRNPSTGSVGIVGEYLVNAQGEDVVAGIRTPENLDSMFDWNQTIALKLVGLVDILEKHYRDMQDIEFTIEDDTLYLLQTRNAKRSPMAAFQVAYDLANEGLISQSEAASRVTASQLFSMMQDSIDPSFNVPADLKGLAAGGGIVSGVAMFTSASAVNCKEPCILVTKETDPDDIAGMNASVGILTATGGLTSHAAVVARGMHKSCVVGATELSFSAGIVEAYVNGKESFTQGDLITIDGATGRVWLNIKVPTIAGGASEAAKQVISWGKSSTSDRIELNYAMGDGELKAALLSSKSPSIYIDTAMVERPSKYTDKSQVEHLMNVIGFALEGCTAKEVVIDLSTASDHYALGDNVMDIMFGVPKSTDTEIQAFKVNSMSKWPVAVIERCLVVLGSAGKGCSDWLKSSGYKVSGSASTVADLLNADAPMSVSPEVIAKVFGGQEAYKAVMDAISNLPGKKPMAPMSVPGYWYEGVTKKVA